MNKTGKKVGYLVLGVALVLAPFIIQDKYFIHLLIEAGLFYMLVAGLNLITGYWGQLTLGHTAFVGLGAYTTAILNAKFNATLPMTLGASIIICLIVSILFGLLVLRLRGPYFVIVSLCFAEMLAIVATNWVDLTNGPMGIPGIETSVISLPGLGELAIESKMGFYYFMLIIVAAMSYIIYRLLHSVIGRASVALRENEILSESVGISAFTYGMIIFVTASIFAGVGGCFYAHYYTYVNPELFGFTYTITMLIMLVIGGKGTFIGPMLGCVVFTILPEMLRGAEYLRDPVLGVILIMVAMFFPHGMGGAIKSIGIKFQNREGR